ncbi:zinc finger protein 708-like isoform X2 [Kryptolebias marmoratus]|uniref:zinc finger protein 708-like isoform X2 n=1 Tax=Kryptolebias marmoratus TaxID=37003 RepID=UPI0007F90103|nr:zinc finger protein 708-like isoform X2 [Kryptolebias marmoratus]
MADLIRFRTEVELIVNGLAKEVVTEIFTAAEKVSLNSQNPEAEEKLGTVVDSLCVEAMNKILKVFHLTAGNQDQTVGEAPPPPEDTCEELTTQTAGSENVGVRGPATEHTYLLLYGSTAADSKCLLMSLQANDVNNAESENKCSSSEAISELMEDRPSSSPPLHNDDHEYARPSSPPEGGVRRDRRQRRKKAIGVSGETHLQCSQCSIMFLNAERLADHEKKSHPLCSVCGAVFTGIMKLREHKIKEHGLLPYTCSYCPKRFNHKAHRDLHVKARHTGEKSCHCDICGRGFSCVSVLKMHRLTHFDKTFICDICRKAFHHACHLTRHKLVHQAVRPYTCSTCGRGFTQSANLRSHQMTHIREKQLCSICGKSFRCLKNHIISKHSHELAAGELPAADTIISCNICGKKFPNLSQYRTHQRSHSGDKPFHCDVCGKSYRLQGMLWDHRYTHSDEKLYSCSVCSKSFKMAASFSRHRSIHSGEMPYSCNDCGKNFRLNTFLKAHLQTKTHLRQVQQRLSAAVTSDLC